MKKVVTIAILLLALTSYVSLQAQTKPVATKNAVTNAQVKHCQTFVDKNNDGKCDNVGTDKQCSSNCDKNGNHAKKQNCTSCDKKSGSASCTGTCDGTGHKGNAAHKCVKK